MNALIYLDLAIFFILTIYMENKLQHRRALSLMEVIYRRQSDSNMDV